MRLEKEKAKELAVHACGGAYDCGQEKNVVIVKLCVAVFVNLSFSSFIERGIRCVRV